MLVCLFGYMDLLIILKWNTNYDDNTQEAPSIINAVVGFVLYGGEIRGRDFFPANQLINNILLFIVAACIPWMLLATPFQLWREHEAKKKEKLKNGGDFEL